MGVFDWLIVGAGCAGAVLAERLANDRNERVLVVDRRPRVAGNAYDHSTLQACLCIASGRTSSTPDQGSPSTICRGRWIDNVFIERLWRSLKYEDIYLKGYADGRDAKAGIGEWLAFYNHRRPHQALANRTPMAVWRDGIAGALGQAAVDMTLRFDNADALPTYPQPLQPQVLVAR